MLSIKKFRTHFYICRAIRWYLTAEITVVRESIQGDEHTIASFRTTPEIMADVSTYDHKELLVIMFNHVSNFLSLGSGWRFDFVQSLSTSLCPFRPTVRTDSFIETPKSLHKKGVLNIQNKDANYCFQWSILGHIHRVDKHADRLYHYTFFFNELVIAGL